EKTRRPSFVNTALRTHSPWPSMSQSLLPVAVSQTRRLALPAVRKRVPSGAKAAHQTIALSALIRRRFFRVTASQTPPVPSAAAVTATSPLGDRATLRIG